MGLFDKLKKRSRKEDVSTVTKSISPTLIELLSNYAGPARQRQLAFGEQVVRNQNWNVDLEKGIISFGKDKYPIQLLGTESSSSNTWLWGFLNQSGFPSALLKDSESTFIFCKTVPELAGSELMLTEFVNGHNISSIAIAAHDDRVCYYGCPHEGGTAYVLVGNVPESIFAPVDAAQVIRLISDLITQFPLDHRTLVKSLLKINCVSVNEADTVLIGLYADGTELSISFDEAGRIANMNTTLSKTHLRAGTDEDKTGDKQEHITIYTVIGDFSRVKDSLTRQFADMTKEILNKEASTPDIEDFVIRFKDDTEIELHINTNQELVGQHISGMFNFFSQIDCGNNNLHRSVLHQIRVFNCIIGTSFITDGNTSRTSCIVDKLFEVAKDISGLVLTQDISLYSNEGKLVFSTEGKSDYDEYSPVGNADFLDIGKKEKPSDIARRERSIMMLQEKGIQYMPKLMAAVMESEARVRSPEEIADRLFAMFSVCVYCEVRNGGEPWEEAQKYSDRINQILGGRLESLLTPEEKAFRAKREPEQWELAKFGWRYECCHVLMWALGIVKELGYPEQICDVSALGKIIWRQESAEDFLTNARPRSKNELLDVEDLMLRYDWACVDARIHKRESPSGLNGEVVHEWHYALNWLVGANGNADWDDISADT